MIRGMEQFCYLRLDDLWPLMDVGGGEPEECEAGVEEEVLPAVVLDETIAVVGAVVLDDQLGVGVVEVGPTDEPASGVMKSGLNLRSGQSRLK